MRWLLIYSAMCRPGCLSSFSSGSSRTALFGSQLGPSGVPCCRGCLLVCVLRVSRFRLDLCLHFGSMDLLYGQQLELAFAFAFVDKVAEGACATRFRQSISFGTQWVCASAPPPKTQMPRAWSSGVLGKGVPRGLYGICRCLWSASIKKGKKERERNKRGKKRKKKRKKGRRAREERD